MIRSKVATVAGEPELEARLATLLSDAKGVELYMRCMDRVEVLAAIRGGGIEVLVVAGAPVWLDRQCVAEAAEKGVRLVGLAVSLDEAMTLAKLGAAVIDVDLDDGLVAEAILNSPQARSIPAEATSRDRGGRMIAVWGPKGAPGRTTVAIELAVACAMRAPSTLLIDADPYGGDVLQRLGITDELPTVVWASRVAARDEMNPGALVGELRRVGPRGPVVLPGLPRGDLWPEVSDFGWKELMDVVRSHFLFSVLDCGFNLEAGLAFDPVGAPNRNHMTLDALQAADTVLAVARPDPVSLKNFVWAYEQLKEQVPPENVKVVVNGVPSSEERGVSDLVKRHTGQRPVACLPERPAEFSKSLLLGQAIGEGRTRSPFAIAMQELAVRLGADVPRRGALTRMSGRR